MSLSAFIVGCGRIAGGFNDADESRVLTHAVALRRLGVPIAGCCDVEPDRAARFAARWQVAYHGGNLPDLLAAARPDLVAVCTPAPVRIPFRLSPRESRRPRERWEGRGEPEGPSRPPNASAGT